MERTPHILVVDDDREIRDLLSKFLAKNGLRVSLAGDGRQMRQVWPIRIDLIVLDLMLPGESGLALCAKVRAASRVPVLMLTAVGEETDRIIGLKPAPTIICPSPSIRVVLARIRAILRRARPWRAPAGLAGGAPLASFRGLAARSCAPAASGSRRNRSNHHGEFDLLAFAEPRRVLSRAPAGPDQGPGGATFRSQHRCAGRPASPQARPGAGRQE
jgi:two-component system OmpR family response regulator